MEMSLAQRAVQVLTTADPRSKTALSRAHAQAWFAGGRPAPPCPSARPPHRCAPPGRTGPHFCRHATCPDAARAPQRVASRFCIRLRTSS